MAAEAAEGAACGARAAERLEADAPGGASGGEQQRERPGSFKELYMDMFTEEFGDDLDALRKAEADAATAGSGSGLRVAALVAAIEAGADVFSPLEKQLYVDHLRPPTRRAAPAVHSNALL